MQLTNALVDKITSQQKDSGGVIIWQMYSRQNTSVTDSAAIGYTIKQSCNTFLANDDRYDVVWVRNDAFVVDDVISLVSFENLRYHMYNFQQPVQVITMSNNIFQLLNAITDPLLGLNAEAMGLNVNLEEKPNHLSLNLQAGFPCHTLANNFLPALEAAIRQANPSLTINTNLDFFVKAHRTQLIGKGLKGVKNTIAIASGKGGVGKSTVTINLATALARAGAKVGILDADIYGPSIPMMLGKHQPVEISGDQYLPVKAHGIYAMSIGYLMDGNQALIWRGPMLAKSLIQMLDITQWDELDYLFIDLPPGTGDIQLSLVQKIPLTAAIVVTTPQNVATLDAEKAIKMFEKTGIDVLGVIENMSHHICSNCGHADAIFGQGGGEQLGKACNIPLLGQLPLDSRIRNQCDDGMPTAIHGDGALADAFMKTALTAAITLAKKPLNYASKFPPVVVE